MKKLLFLVVVLSLLIPHPVRCQVPNTISYQGVLKESDGSPVQDGTMEFVFNIYTVPTGGTGIWADTISVLVQNGIMNVVLGGDRPLDIAFDEPYWLGIAELGGSEFSPRTRLTASPYSLSSQSVTGLANVFPSNGNVGIGTTAPTAKLHISGTPGADGIMFPDGTVQLTAGGGMTLDAAYDKGGPGAGRTITADAGAVNIEGPDGLTVNGDVGVGTSSPQEKLDVIGTVRMSGFKMPTGASNGYVLVSDANGVGTWSDAALGDVTAVYADNGLTGGGVSGDLHMNVGGGDGIDVLSDEVSVDAGDLAGNGLNESGNDLHVNPGTGLEISGDAVQLSSMYISGSPYDDRFVNEGQSNSITSGMISDGTIQFGDIGQNGAAPDWLMTWNGAAWVAAPPAGGDGDITAVYADDGLTGGATENDAHVGVGAGDGIDVTADDVRVDVTDFAGSGLGEEAANDLAVNTGTGIEIAADAVQLAAPYSSGEAYDSRFVNEDQPGSVTSAMISDGTIQFGDIGQNGAGDGQVIKWNGAAWEPADEDTMPARGLFPRPRWQSDWITLPAGGTETVTHSIGGDPEDYFVDLQTKDDNGLGLHNRYTGGEIQCYGYVNNYHGCFYRDLTSSSITVSRGSDDYVAPYVRVRIWLVQ